VQELSSSIKKWVCKKRKKSFAKYILTSSVSQELLLEPSLRGLLEQVAHAQIALEENSESRGVLEIHKRFLTIKIAYIQ
jgi:hypothetical protein